MPMAAHFFLIIPVTVRDVIIMGPVTGFISCLLSTPMRQQALLFKGFSVGWP
jgi:hypothetical protein